MEMVENANEACQNKAKKRMKRQDGYQWICTHCNEEFPTRKVMTEHKKATHTQEHIEMRYNYSRNKEEGTYTCKTCHHYTKCSKEMEEHMLSHKQNYKCEECQAQFYSPWRYAGHMKKHSDDGIYRCPLCKFTTLKRFSITQHINLRHLNFYLYNCKVCGKGYHDVNMFRDHENIHLGAAPLVCVVCQKEFSFTKNLMRHQTKFHTVNIAGVPLKNQCKVCKKKFLKPISLERHMAVHAKEDSKPREKVHLCDNCGKGFARKDKLMLHYRVHTGYKPYKCGFCEKAFTKKDYLVMHERIHSGEKPYCCAHCGKRFNQDASLRIHVRGHTGERPYVCDICETGFVSRAALNAHLHNCTG